MPIDVASYFPKDTQAALAQQVPAHMRAIKGSQILQIAVLVNCLLTAADQSAGVDDARVVELIRNYDVFRGDTGWDEGHKALVPRKD